MCVGTIQDELSLDIQYQSLNNTVDGTRTQPGLPQPEHPQTGRPQPGLP